MTVSTDGPYAGFEGEISYRLPKTFDWLHYGFFAQSETWGQRYWQTKEIDWGPYKVASTPYPAYGPVYSEGPPDAGPGLSGSTIDQGG